MGCKNCSNSNFKANIYIKKWYHITITTFYFESCSQWLSVVPQLELWVLFPLASGSCVLVFHLNESMEEYFFHVFISPPSHYQVIQNIMGPPIDDIHSSSFLLFSLWHSSNFWRNVMGISTQIWYGYLIISNIFLNIRFIPLLGHSQILGGSWINCPWFS